MLGYQTNDLKILNVFINLYMNYFWTESQNNGNQSKNDVVDLQEENAITDDTSSGNINYNVVIDGEEETKCDDLLTCVAKALGIEVYNINITTHFILHTISYVLSFCIAKKIYFSVLPLIISS